MKTTLQDEVERKFKEWERACRGQQGSVLYRIELLRFIQQMMVEYARKSQ